MSRRTKEQDCGDMQRVWIEKKSTKMYCEEKWIFKARQAHLEVKVSGALCIGHPLYQLISAAVFWMSHASVNEAEAKNNPLGMDRLPSVENLKNGRAQASIS
ncbi:hypothetical protein BSKO_09594 [Bryopsis sp. KO-2023]|nr:hypothetical protein BSKO_09594 [Bryopsis sp. KO-2023]